MYKPSDLVTENKTQKPVWRTRTIHFHSCNLIYYIQEKKKNYNDSILSSLFFVLIEAIASEILLRIFQPGLAIYPSLGEKKLAVLFQSFRNDTTSDIATALLQFLLSVFFLSFFFQREGTSSLFCFCLQFDKWRKDMHITRMLNACLHWVSMWKRAIRNYQERHDKKKNHFASDVLGVWAWALNKLR